jgi:hypothetical protein
MKITNFRDYKIVPDGHFSYYQCALVDIETETGCLFWKKKKIESREVFSRGAFWRFLDDGEYTPILTIEKLAASYIARQKLAGRKL